MLEALPVELFHNVASYLHFLDKKALSTASRRRNAKIGHFECPDQLTWLVHLCRCPANLHSPLFENPEAFRDLISSVNLYVRRKYEWPSTIKVDFEALESPYFPRPFPESTLLYHYMTIARDSVQSAIQIPVAAGLDPSLAIPRNFWGQIKDETADVVRWLELLARVGALLQNSMAL